MFAKGCRRLFHIIIQTALIKSYSPSGGAAVPFRACRAGGGTTLQDPPAEPLDLLIPVTLIRFDALKPRASAKFRRDRWRVYPTRRPRRRSGDCPGDGSGRAGPSTSRGPGAPLRGAE